MKNILLIRTEMSGAPIGTPLVIDRKDIPKPGNFYYSATYQMTFKLVVNHSYSPDDKSPLYTGIVHAIYDVEK